MDFAVYASGTGCGAIKLSGNAYTDSFDSSQGSYAQTKQLSKGIVGVSGNIDLSGSATINGPVFAVDATVGRCSNGTPGISLSGGAKATGGYIQLDNAPAFPDPVPVTPGSQDYNLNSDTSLAPGSYGNITVNGGKTLTFSPGTYNINSVTLNGGSALRVDPGGQVVINVAGNSVSQAIQLNGGSNLANPSGIALNFQIIYGGNLPIALTGGPASFVVLYAPNAPVTLSGGTDWYGAMAVNTLDVTGNIGVHYDRSLAVPPTITGIVAPVPTAAGWNNSAVTVTFTCTDTVVGIASCTLPVAVTMEGANQVVTGTAVNRAGFSASTTVTVNIDKAPPVISRTASPSPNAAGWNNSDVTVTFSCSDALSGVAQCPSPAIVSMDGIQTISGTATDKAGNTAVTSVTVKLDKTPPAVSITSPANGSIVAVASQTISGTLMDALSGIAGVTCIGAPATVIGDTFSCTVALMLGTNSILIRATDVAGNISTSAVTLNRSSAAPTITITSPTNLSYLNISPTTINGTVSDSTATVTVNSIAAPVANGQFSIQLPLAEGPNIITATATNAAGVGTASIEVTLDTTPPHVTITSPPDKFITTDTAISVAGIVNDIVVGTVNDQQAQVTVNGSAAQVSNRTFLATNVPLNLGDNVIQAVGRDRVGNAATTQITVTRQAPSAQSQIHLISGNNQTSTIGSVLPAPLVVALTDSTGNPVPNKPVIFKITQNNGMIAAGSAPAASAVATTDAQGQAQAQWTLGMRAGAGGNTLEAYSVGAGGTAIFNATGNQGPAGKIVIDANNDQIGVVNQALPKPLIAVVIDAGNNRLADVPVTFTVKQGGGSLLGQSGTTFTVGQNVTTSGGQSITVNSDSDGRVAATLILGFQEGNANNLVEADFAGNQSFPAAFTASGRAAGDPLKTTISGVVLDNSNVPIPGATIRAVLTNVLTSNATSVNSAATVVSDAQGQFSISPAPVGFVKLMIDGSTAQLPGTYPHMDYDMVTVAGQVNTVGQPIYLLPLSATNQLCATATTGGGTLTIPEAPGFSLTFGPGQVTFPGGTKTGCIGVTVVHGDRVPMAPGFGQQPRFIVTIQPAGAIFNPPAAITLPNVDGLKPREVTEMYSFDHDIGSFVAIGTGTVSDDGQVIRSNPGVGVLKAGWHCGGNPQALGTTADCGFCKRCVSTSANPSGECVVDTVPPCNQACAAAGFTASNILNSTSALDPTYIFAHVQTCIAQALCLGSQNLEDPDWLNRVLPDFIDAWANRTGNWNLIIGECFALDLPLPFGQQLCAARMALYHISVDLLNALLRQGCGTDADWAAIERIIEGCVSNGLSPLPSSLVAPIIDLLRNSVRSMCLSQRP